MKRTLILLSLFSVPGMLTSCKDEAATPAPVNTATVAAVTESAPEQVVEEPSTASAEVSQLAVFHLDKLCHLLGFTDAEIKIIRAGYTGDTATLGNLKDKNHIGIYCIGATAGGNKELVLQCLDKGADPNDGLIGAALGGHMDIVQLMLEKGADPNGGLIGAASGGHMDIVQLMLDKGATGYNRGLIGAALGGHMDIVQLMLNKGATYYNDGLIGAASGGHMDIVQLLLDKGATNYNRGLEVAARGGHMDIVQLMLKKGATDYNVGLEVAASGGHMDIVQLMLEKGATDYNRGLEGAAWGGHMDIVQLMLEKGANPNEALYSAALSGRAEIIKILLVQPSIDVNQKNSWGSTALDAAVDTGHNDCAELLRAAGGKRGKEL